VSEVWRLIDEAAEARNRVAAAAARLSAEQGAFAPPAEGGREAWSAAQLVEHLVLAEQADVLAAWAALDALRGGSRPAWTGEPVHRGRRIEEVVCATWREREDAPAPTRPRAAGGPLDHWVAALYARQPLLEALGAQLGDAVAVGITLDRVVHPHPICGPLDARQRLELLRFHMDRHCAQIDALVAHPAFPPPPPVRPRRSSGRGRVRALAADDHG